MFWIICTTIYTCTCMYIYIYISYIIILYSQLYYYILRLEEQDLLLSEDLIKLKRKKENTLILPHSFVE